MVGLLLDMCLSAADSSCLVSGVMSGCAVAWPSPRNVPKAPVTIPAPVATVLYPACCIALNWHHYKCSAGNKVQSPQRLLFFRDSQRSVWKRSEDLLKGVWNVTGSFVVHPFSNIFQRLIRGKSVANGAPVKQSDLYGTFLGLRLRIRHWSLPHLRSNIRL